MVALAVVAIVALVVLGSVVWVSETLREPQGAWDAWDFWNMRGRFFVRAGQDWPRAYSEVMAWSHPSYPPLTSASVARGFHLLGSESVLVPAILAAVFTLAPPLLLAWTVYRLRGGLQAALAAITLLAVPYFVTHGSDQYADAPLSFFFLATFACFALHDGGRGEGRLLMLAGTAGSLAALTKNEGDLFLVTVVVARSVVAWRAGGRSRWMREGARFAAGALPVGILVLVFKLGYSVMPVSGEFFVGRFTWWDHGPLQHIVTQLTTPDRWVGFVESWWHHLTHFDASWPVPLAFSLPVYAVIAGRSPRRPRASISTMLGVFGLQAFVVSALFLAWSTYEIREHMDALQRLLYQMLPSVLLAVFLAMRSPFERAQEPPPEEEPAAMAEPA